MTLIHVMRTECPALEPEARLSEAMHQMAEGGHWVLPVCSGSILVGSLSMQDVVKCGIADIGAAHGLTVRDAMSSSPYRCSLETTPEEARDLLCAHRQPALCVTSAAGALVGVVDAFDLIEALREPHGYAGPEPDYVHHVRGVH